MRMKAKIYFICTAIFAAMLLGGCGEKKQEVNPGAVVTTVRDKGDFSAVVLNGDAELIITPTDSTGIRIEADSTIINKIKTKIENNTLTIDYKKEAHSKKIVRIFVSIIQIDRLECNGTVTLSTTEPLDSDSLVCKISGAGIYQLLGTAKKEYIEISGAAEVHGFDLKTKNCIVKISGAGTVETSVSDTLSVTISGIGNVVYQGKPVIAHKQINGLGKVKERPDVAEKK
jgi:hypothetical protein